MSEEQQTLVLYWGALADPISKQLKDKGYNLPNSKLYYFDRIKEALNVLYFNKLTTGHQYNVINIRCHNYVIKEVEKWLKEHK